MISILEHNAIRASRRIIPDQILRAYSTANNPCVTIANHDGEILGQVPCNGVMVIEVAVEQKARAVTEDGE